MTKFKKILILGVAVFILGATTITAFAASDYNISADITAEQFQDYKDEILANKKAILDQRVKDGILTQEEADEILDAIENNQAYCDGTGNAGIGRGMGAGFGGMMGYGNGQGGFNGCGNRAFYNSNLQVN